jgi:hypothetical protein
MQTVEGFGYVLASTPAKEEKPQGNEKEGAYWAGRGVWVLRSHNRYRCTQSGWSPKRRLDISTHDVLSRNEVFIQVLVINRFYGSIHGATMTSMSMELCTLVFNGFCSRRHAKAECFRCFRNPWHFTFFFWEWHAFSLQKMAGIHARFHFHAEASRLWGLKVSNHTKRWKMLLFLIRIVKK